MASLLGAVWVVETDGDVASLTTADIHLINDDAEQWLEASVGHFGSSGTDFVIAASNASKAISLRYTGGDVTDPANYEKYTVVDSSNIDPFIPGGMRVYGLDVGDDMDGDGMSEIVFSRGSTRGGETAPAIFIMEGSLKPVGIEDGDGVVRSFKLLQNYPNPFNPETSITFSLPVAGVVQLDIFNLLGQKVRTLVNGLREASVHTVQWNGKNDAGVQVPSGLYFYRIKAEGFTDTKRMLLLK